MLLQWPKVVIPVLVARSLGVFGLFSAFDLFKWLYAIKSEILQMDFLGMVEKPAYPTTIWSEVRRAEDSVEELGNLLKKYYLPLQSHLEFKFKRGPEQSKDWLQDFIHRKVLLKDFLATASRERGRFRTFLLNTLDNFVVSKLRMEAAEIRRPEGGTISIEELPSETLADWPDNRVDPFALHWARAVVAEAVSRMQSRCEAKGCLERWEVFKTRLLDPLLEGAQAPPYEQLVRHFGFQSPAEAANVLVTAKRMYCSVLREVISEYTGEGADVENEIGELKRSLASVF